MAKEAERKEDGASASVPSGTNSTSHARIVVSPAEVERSIRTASKRPLTQTRLTRYSEAPSRRKFLRPARGAVPSNPSLVCPVHIPIREDKEKQTLIFPKMIITRWVPTHSRKVECTAHDGGYDIDKGSSDYGLPGASTHRTLGA